MKYISLPPIIVGHRNADTKWTRMDIVLAALMIRNLMSIVKLHIVMCILLRCQPMAAVDARLDKRETRNA